jgi:hypothetical protein
VQQQPQRPNNKRKKLANRAGILAIAAACAAAAVGAGPQTARAIVVATPRPGAASPLLRTPHYSTEVPLDASLFFVLDGTISSRLKPGTVVRAHLRDPLVLGGTTIAAAGSPVDIEVYQTNAAHMGNEDGSVDIYFQPLHLADGKDLPLITPTAHIDPHVSVGQYNTQAVTDTIGDIFIPGHYIYHILRKGRDVVLGPGTVLRARTSAKVTVEKGAVVLATPQPFVTPGDTPHPAFVPAPMYTPPGFVQPTPKPSPSAKPTSTP